MAIERYDHYGPARMSIAATGAYLIRDVLTYDARYAGICEFAVYETDGEIRWRICREGVDFSEILPFLPAESVKA